jgi:protein HOOK3
VEALTAEEIESLDILKRANQSITSSLQNDLLLLQSKHKSLEIDLQQQQNHLVQALLATNKLEKELVMVKEGKVGSQSAIPEVSKEVSHDFK